MQRQDLITAFVNQLKRITTAKGYDTNIGANVNSSYKYDLDDSELPFVNVVEDGASVAQTAGSQWLHSCPVRVDVVALGTIDDARKMANDVLKAISSDKTIGGYCDNVEPGEVELFHDEDRGKTYVAVSVGVTLLYITDEWSI